jgi:anaerobic sulfite reductase subunit B
MATPLPTEPVVAGPPAPFRVAARRRETHDTWTLRLVPVSGEGIAVRPGQFTMLYAFGVGEVPISVSGDIEGPLVHTVRAVGAVTTAVCAARKGTPLGVRGPFGNTWPLEEAAGGDVVIVAGGIGLAPLRPVLYEVLRRREEYGEVMLLYGSRTPRDLLYVRELERWPNRFDVKVDVTVDSAEGDWRGKVGVAPKLIAGARFEPSRTTALVCGPEIMMHFTVQELLDRGIPAERIHVSLERNMRCGVGHCGHCQLGSTLICRDGPVYRYSDVQALMAVREL